MHAPKVVYGGESLKFQQQRIEKSQIDAGLELLRASRPVFRRL